MLHGLIIPCKAIQSQFFVYKLRSQQLKVKSEEVFSANVNLKHEVDGIPALKERLESYRIAKCEAVSDARNLRR
jgi:hypothetical protein